MLKILLVDENEFFRELMALRFELEFESTIASVSSEIKAIELLKEDKEYDLIVVDFPIEDDSKSQLLDYVSQNLPKTSVALTSLHSNVEKVKLPKFLGVFSKLKINSLINAVSNSLLH